MKYFSTCLFLFFLSLHTLWGQKGDCGDIRPAYSLKANSSWTLSDSLGLDFNGANGPEAFNSKSYSGPVISGATVADSSGQLLFYTSGTTVWAADGSVMPHGQQLTGGMPLSAFWGQVCQVVQVPYQPEKYYIFTISWQTNFALYCNLVDMSLNNGLGDVVDSFYLRGIPLDNPSIPPSINSGLATRLAAVAGCSHDVWLLCHDKFASIFRAFRISPSGIDTVPVISDFSNEWPIGQQGGAYYSLEGYLVPSPNGKKIVLTNNTSDYRITDYDFNPATGKLSNPQILVNGHLIAGIINYFTGAAFSPDNSKLYGTYTDTNDTHVILQYDLNSPGPDSLIQPTVIDTLELHPSYSQRTRGIQLGHDGKIYFGVHPYYFSYGPGTGEVAYRKLGRINYPDNAGAACGLEDSVANIDFSALPVQGYFQGSFPNPVVIPQSSLHITVHFQNDTLFALPNNFDHYQWYHNGNAVAGGTAAYLPVNDTSGLYAVTVVDTNCGCSDSVLYNITGHLGIGSMPGNSSSIRVYPNPANQVIDVQSPQPVNLSLYDLAGRLLQQTKGRDQMDIAAFADGVYLLRIEDSQGRFLKMEKVVKRSR